MKNSEKLALDHVEQVGVPVERAHNERIAHIQDLIGAASRIRINLGQAVSIANVSDAKNARAAHKDPQEVSTALNKISNKDNERKVEPLRAAPRFLA